jgi:uncharacterized coiled-coil protein SlyX
MVSIRLFRACFCGGLLAACALVPSGAVAQESGGSELLIEELRFALETADRRISELEAQLAAPAERSREALSAALAAANREAEEYRVRFRDLLVRVESLGLATVRSDRALEDRLLLAVRERQSYLEKHQGALEQMMRLTEAVVNYLKASGEEAADARSRLEAELRRTDETLGFGFREDRSPERAKALTDGRVIGAKGELGLVVVDVGRRSGVRVGMPLNVYRKDRLVGTALVVDVREDLAGALVQELLREGDRVELQDRVEPRTQEPEAL